jgi:hypothetical protein
VANRDASTEALRAVEKATGSGRARGEDLLGSEKLKKKLREAKKRLAGEKSRGKRP